MSDLERRQFTILSDLRLLVANANMLISLMEMPTIDGPGTTSGECIQSGADTIRMLAAELMANV